MLTLLYSKFYRDKSAQNHASMRTVSAFSNQTETALRLLLFLTCIWETNMCVYNINLTWRKWLAATNYLDAVYTKKMAIVERLTVWSIFSACLPFLGDCKLPRLLLSPSFASPIMSRRASFSLHRNHGYRERTGENPGSLVPFFSARCDLLYDNGITEPPSSIDKLASVASSFITCERRRSSIKISENAFLIVLCEVAKNNVVEKPKSNSKLDRSMQHN